MKNLKCEECVFFDELDTEQPCCCCFDNINFVQQPEEPRKAVWSDENATVTMPLDEFDDMRSRERTMSECGLA